MFLMKLYTFVEQLNDSVIFYEKNFSKCKNVNKNSNLAAFQEITIFVGLVERYVHIGF